jgi:hypothetical protein
MGPPNVHLIFKRVMKERLLFCIFCFLVFGVNAQIPSPKPYPIPDDVQSESVTLVVNTTFFLTGETLLFKVFCFNQSRPSQLSEVSSVAYVELIGEDLKPVTQMKVKLEKGVGNGDFFFDSRIASGNYTLIAYTKWMRNFGDSRFFSERITVVNPAVKPATASPTATHEQAESHNEENATHGLSVQFPKINFHEREKVTLQLAGDSTVSLALLVNVRALDTEMGFPSRLSELRSMDSITANQRRLLPDLRGELVSGRITDKATGQPLVKKLVSLSGPAKRFSFLMSTTDSDGRYYFNVHGVESNFLLMKVMGADMEEVVVQHDSEFLEDYDRFAPPKLALDTSLRALIEKRYLSAQIENAFYAVKTDSIKNPDDVFPFFITADHVYHLDDFTRFPTMDDVFREVVPEVVVKVRDGSYSLLVKNSVSGYRFTNEPLMLIDGVPINDANILMHYDPLQIKTITLVTRHYFYGGLEADGIVSIQTYEGEAKNLPVNNMIRVNYIQVQSPKVCFTPDYEGRTDLTRVPDFRTQLYWNPDIYIAPGDSQTLTFFTNDVEGKYAVEIAGVSSAGERIYWRGVFSVIH